MDPAATVLGLETTHGSAFDPQMSVAVVAPTGAAISSVVSNVIGTRTTRSIRNSPPWSKSSTPLAQRICHPLGQNSARGGASAPGRTGLREVATRVFDQ